MRLPIKPLCEQKRVRRDGTVGGPFFSKAADMFSRNSAFHLEIITWFTSNLTASSASVCWFLMASSATLALKSAEIFRRFVFHLELVKITKFYLTNPIVRI